MNSYQITKYLKSRTVWAGLIAFVLNIAAMLQISAIAGMPIEDIAANKGQLASQITVIAAGICDVLAIIFRIRVEANFD